MRGATASVWPNHVTNIRSQIVLNILSVSACGRIGRFRALLFPNTSRRRRVLWFSGNRRAHRVSTLTHWEVFEESSNLSLVVNHNVFKSMGRKSFGKFNGANDNRIGGQSDWCLSIVSSMVSKDFTRVNTRRRKNYFCISNIFIIYVMYLPTRFRIAITNRCYEWKIAKRRYCRLKPHKARLLFFFYLCT